MYKFQERKWVPWEKCEKNENNCLKIYVARASHANYPKSGVWFRIFCFANDLCSNLGKKIIPILLQDNFNFNPPNFEKNSLFKKRIVMTK